MPLHLTEEESAELLLLLNDADLSQYPQLQRIQERLRALRCRTSTVTTTNPSRAPPPALSQCLSESTPPDRDRREPPPQSPAENHSQPEVSPFQPEYKWTKKDDEFRRALNTLRRDRTQTLYGLAVLNNLGPYLIMDDSVLDEIAACARAHKLASLDDLYRETRWYQTWELGGQVLELVSRYYPPHTVEDGPLSDREKGTTML